MKVSVLGLGIMGAGMAGQLVAKGFEVSVWNRNPAKAARFGETRRARRHHAGRCRAAVPTS